MQYVVTRGLPPTAGIVVTIESSGGPTICAYVPYLSNYVAN